MVDMERTIQQFNTSTGHTPLLLTLEANLFQPFPFQFCNHAHQAGCIPLIRIDLPASMPLSPSSSTLLERIIQGNFDSLIQKWAKGMEELSFPILVHLFPQFNVGSHPWSVENNRMDNAFIRDAFRHIARKIEEDGVKHIQWVWGPYVFPSPSAGWNDRWDEAYPGDAYVDFISLEGLDFGESGKISFPLSFEQLFVTPIHRIQTFAPQKPILLTEVATSQQGKERQRWIRHMARMLSQQFPMVRAMIWYHHAEVPNWRLREEDRPSFQNLDSTLTNPSELFSKPLWPFSLFAQKIMSPPLIPSITTPYLESKDLKTLLELGRKIPSISLNPSPTFLIGADVPVGHAFSVKGHFAWNHDAFLFLCTIQDPSPGEGRSQPEEIWNGDCLEFGFCPPFQDNDIPRDYDRVLISPGGPQQLDPTAALIRGDRGDLSPDINEMNLKSQFGVSTREYRLYGSIPWTLLGVVPWPETEIRFHFAVTDASQDRRQRQLIWSGGAHAYHTPSEWGRIVFKSESDESKQ
jgi:hypothetical protein